MAHFGSVEVKLAAQHGDALVAEGDDVAGGQRRGGVGAVALFIDFGPAFPHLQDRDDLISA